MKTTPITRREFVRSASLLSAATLAFPSIMRGQQANPPGNRLNVACVGVGGRVPGHLAVEGAGDRERRQRPVLCRRPTRCRQRLSLKAHPGIGTDRRFRDYRKMLDSLGGQIDAVTVSTPDHMHFPVAMAALSLGKHVFVEKPLAHTITEARTLARVAREKGVATQMGNQGHAGEGCRLLKEWVEAGVLGDVTEVHSWTDRPIWPQGVGVPDHTKMMPVVPASLDWDLWLGVASQREYDPAYLPFTWRGFWDFGTGAIGDMACHILDGAFFALDLAHPSRIEAVSARQTQGSAPLGAVVTYQFPARGSKVPLVLTWYDGGMQPTLPAEFAEGQLLESNGTLIVGSKRPPFLPTPTTTT